MIQQLKTSNGNLPTNIKNDKQYRQNDTISDILQGVQGQEADEKLLVNDSNNSNQSNNQGFLIIQQ